MAEEKGFKPLEPVKIRRFSRPLHLITLPLFRKKKMVRSTGLEPVTIRLEGGCSIQLS